MADKKITELTTYSPPVDNDVLPIVDTTLGVTMKITWANIKAALKTYFDSLTTTLTNKTLTSPVLTTPQINDTSANHQYITAVSELTADRTVTLPLLTGNDEFVFKDHAQTLTNKTLTSPKINEDVALTATATQLNAQVLAGNDGWTSANETWEYVSVDDPTGIFRINADVTTKYSAGMRIKFTNGGNVIYGIITVVGSFSGGYTSITFLHQIDPSDNLALVLMANSAITLNYYSTQKAPQGFPLEPTKWSRTYKTTSNVGLSPTTDTWYNHGSVLLAIPIGSWLVGYKNMVYGQTSDAQAIKILTTLSTANNSASDGEFTTEFYSSAPMTVIRKTFTMKKFLNLTAKTTYYLNTKIVATNCNALHIIGSDSTIIVEATCAYL